MARHQKTEDPIPPGASHRVTSEPLKKTLSQWVEPRETKPHTAGRPVQVLYRLCKNRCYTRAPSPIVAMRADRFSPALLLTILTTVAISRVSINPTPSTCHLLFIIFAPHRRCCLATADKGEGVGDTELTWAILSGSDCNNLTVTEVTC